MTMYEQKGMIFHQKVKANCRLKIKCRKMLLEQRDGSPFENGIKWVARFTTAMQLLWAYFPKSSWQHSEDLLFLTAASKGNIYSYYSDISKTFL